MNPPPTDPHSPRSKEQMRAAMHALRSPRSAGENHNYTVTVAGLVGAALLLALAATGASWWAVVLAEMSMAMITIAAIVSRRRFKTWRENPPQKSTGEQLVWLGQSLLWQAFPLGASLSAFIFTVITALTTSGRTTTAAIMVGCVTVTLCVALFYTMRAVALLRPLIDERTSTATPPTGT